MLITLNKYRRILYINCPHRICDTDNIKGWILLMDIICVTRIYYECSTNTQSVNHQTNRTHHLTQTEQPPVQIPASDLPPGCQTGFVVNIPADIQQHAPECGERAALLSLIKDEGLLRAG